MDTPSTRIWFEIQDKKGLENLVSYDLSRLPLNEEPLPLKDDFPDEYIFSIHRLTPWYAYIINYLVTNAFPDELSRTDRKTIKRDANYYVWNYYCLWKHCIDKIIERCLSKIELPSIEKYCHLSAYGGNFDLKRITHKVLECGLY